MEILVKHISEAIAKIDPEDFNDETVLDKLVRKHGKCSTIPLLMAKDFFTGGIDTTGHTAEILLYHLAKNPEKQEKLYQEICSSIGKDGKLTQASVMKMS